MPIVGEQNMCHSVGWNSRASVVVLYTVLTLETCGLGLRTSFPPEFNHFRHYFLMDFRESKELIIHQVH